LRDDRSKCEILPGMGGLREVQLDIAAPLSKLPAKSERDCEMSETMKALVLRQHGVL
jgi:hypothetical protein